MPNLFISYSRRDKDFVARLNEALNARGKEAWVDWKDIPASAEWLREIQEGIDSTDAFLFVLSPDSVRSDVCARELDHAVERRKRILPIVYRDVDPATVRAEAAAINWVYLRDQDAFEAGLETLIEALDTDLEYVKAHTRLANQAISWDRPGRDRARLLRGSELEAAERWLTESASKQPAATELQAQFVQASRDAARSRGRVIFGAVAVALIVAIALAVVALIQRADAVHQSHVAFARELDADAVGQYDTDPELSVLLATKAAQVAPGAATREALRSALARSHVRQRYTNPAGQRIGDALWSPDGSRLLISEEDAHQAMIVIPGSRTPPLVLTAPGVVSQIAWDAAGKLALTGGSQVKVWNGNTGRLVRRLPAVGLEVAIAPRGDRVANVDPHRHLQVWSVGSGRPLAGITLPGGTPTCLQFSPDGAVLAVCLLYGVSPRDTVRSSAQLTGGLVLLDARSSQILHTIPLPGPFESVAFSPDSRRVAVASNAASSSVRGASVFDVHTGATVLSFPGAASAVTFSPDGKRLAYATLLGSIGYVYTFADGTSQPLVGNAGTINSIAFSPDGAYVVTGSSDRTARVFEYLSGKQVELLAGHTGPVTDARMNADDTELVTASGDGTARVWTTPVPRPEAQLLIGPGPVAGTAFSPHTGELAVFGPGGSGRLLDQSSLHQLATFAAPPGDVFLGGAWSPDGRWLGALAGPLQGQKVLPGGAYVYDARTGVRTANIAPASPVASGALDGQGHLATASAGGAVQLWDSSGHLLRTLVAGGPVQDLQVTDDASKLAATHPSGAIDIFSGSGVRLLRLLGPAPQPQIVGTQFFLPVVAAFSPDGRWLASAGADKNVQLWDLDSGRKVGELPGGPFISLAFNHAGTQLAAGSAASAFVWQVPSGVLLRELQHADSSTYGTVIASGFGVHVAFSADDQTLATTGDFALRAWNLATGDSLFDAFSSLGAMSSDASRLVGVQAGAVKLYRCELCGGIDQLLAAAQQNVTRPLAPGERALYLHQS